MPTWDRRGPVELHEDRGKVLKEDLQLNTIAYYLTLKLCRGQPNFSTFEQYEYKTSKEYTKWKVNMNYLRMAMFWL